MIPAFSRARIIEFIVESTSPLPVTSAMAALLTSSPPSTIFLLLRFRFLRRRNGRRFRSINFFKNMTCGEGGAITVKKKALADRIANLTDCCGFFWTGRQKSFDAFCAGSARKSEIEGAILNAQLDRLPRMIRTLRSNQKKLLRATAKCGLTPVIRRLCFQPSA